MDQVSSGASACAHFKVQPSYATDTATATALIAEIVTDAGEGRIAIDLETTPLPSERERCAELARRAAAAKGRVKVLRPAQSAAPQRCGGQTARRRLRPHSRSPRRSLRRS